MFDEKKFFFVISVILISFSIFVIKSQIKLNRSLSDLPVNKWIEIYKVKEKKFRRQAHAGIAFDSKRGSVLLFGSDTHNYDWDNSVHEFNPRDRTWSTHYPSAPKDTYRIDGAGNAVCGNNKLLPWAMHTFDNVLYDPATDSLFVTALPAHNPIKKKFKKKIIHPTWIYSLKDRKWKIFVNSNMMLSPTFFAAGSAYDQSRNVIVAYKKGGVWELGPDRDKWIRATKESHHEIHFNVAYDSLHKVFAVFGNHHNTNEVWVYIPGLVAGDKGIWEKKIPGGDLCPKDQHFPVAFDNDNGVFLIVPDNMRFTKDDQDRIKSLPPESASTFVYDYKKNKYTKLPVGDLFPQKMNYMMVYDSTIKVFFLITGDHKKPLTVMALKLDLTQL